AGDRAADPTGPDSGPRMILHHPPEPKTARNSIHPVLVTDHHDEEIERLTALGARPLNQITLPPEALPPGVAAVRQTTLADPEGNELELVTWQMQPEQWPPDPGQGKPAKDARRADEREIRDHAVR